MEITVTHNNMDFDALAAQFAVSKLYPGTVMVPGHPLAGNIRNFFSLYRDSLPLADVNYLDLEKIKHVYLVDCQHADRLDDTTRKLFTSAKPKCTYTIFDHHQLDPAGLGPRARDDSIIRPVGAATSILVEQIRKRKIGLTAFEATLLTIGIYEDTGCLTYSGTTELDASCVAFLLKQEADLSRVSEYLNPKLTENQRQLFAELAKNAKTLSLSGVKVVIAHGSWPGYLEGLAILTRRLLELVSADAAVCAVHMRDRVHVVGRSDTPVVDVRRLACEFGGDGHKGAASAVVKKDHLRDIIKRVETLLKAQAQPEKVASEIMTSPVTTILPETTMDEASRIMLRYAQDGLIVVEESAVVGVVSRRDIDKAVHHKLGHAPVSGFMSRPVITIDELTPLSQIQQLMVKEDIGRLPVLDQQSRLVGIVTRKDVLRTLYGKSAETDYGGMHIGEQKRSLKLNEKLGSLEPLTKWLFTEIGKMAASKNMAAYAVGGCVRDLFLGLPNFDLDFVVEGSAIALADALKAAYPAQFEIVAKHERFQTASLLFLNGTSKHIVDFSTARIEFYEFPAALPTVEAAPLKQDLFRRDFTINALAVCLNPACFGDVVDFFNGIYDLEHKYIRILHPFSFIEDPTRLIRAVRFATRLGFRLEARTREHAQRAINMGIFDNLGGVRLKEEIKLILASAQRLKALDLLAELGGNLRYLDVKLRYDKEVRQLLVRAERLLARYKVEQEWIIYLGILLSQLKTDSLNAALTRLYLSNEEKEWITKGIVLPTQFGTKSKQWGGLKHSEIADLLCEHADQALAIAASLATPGSITRRSIKLYLEELKNVHVTLSGHDLIKMGIPEGPGIGDALAQLHKAKLDGIVRNTEEEIAFLKQVLAK